MNRGSGEALWPPRDGPDFTPCEAERLTTHDMLEPKL
jgi:hypothetical protein